MWENTHMIHIARTKNPADQSGTFWYHLSPMPSRRMAALFQMVSSAVLGACSP